VHPISAGGRIIEPVPRDLTRVLRQAVLAHAREGHRRSYPPALHVGDPASPLGLRRLEVGGEDWDHTLRIEVVQAMVAPFLGWGPLPLTWLTRPYASAGAQDHPWAAATEAAGAELGAPLSFVVVTRRSWCDPRSEVGRTWQRAIRRR
jgi:hypothetical protein